MKKLIPLALIAVTAVMFTSCKKDYTCKCSYTLNGVTTVLGSVTIHDTKSNAKDACNKEVTSFNTSGVTATVQCSIQ
jgi:hypothetical protein